MTGFAFDLLYGGVTAAYGGPVIYDAGGPRHYVVGTFTQGGELVREDGSVFTTLPQFMIPRANLPVAVVPQRGHRLTRQGVLWKVEEVGPDNDAAWTLFLKRLNRP